MKDFIQSIAHGLGHHISRWPRDRREPLPVFEVALTTLGSCTKRLVIAQVGANDGSIGDPIYPFVQRLKERTSVILIEPQKTLIPHLTKNYQTHPNHHIFNGAVGPGGTLTFFSVAEEFWRALQLPDNPEWPDYRAPTGATSTSRSHVEQWLEVHLPSDIDPDNAIESWTTECLPLPDILQRLGLDEKIDVLQVDAEGFDDEVIYHSAIERTAPRLIHFESQHLDTDRSEALRSFLAERGYLVFSSDSHNQLAIASSSRDCR